MQRTDDQTAFARRLRRKQTFAERILWILLRDRELAGYKFRRQHPIGPYFGDFVCMRHRLVIECDGVTHLGRQQYDHARDIYLRATGHRVLRFSDERVQGNPDRVVAEILAELTKPSPPPSP